MHALTFNHGEYKKLAQDWWESWHGNRISEKQLSPLGVVVLGNDGPVLLTHLMPAMTAPVVWMGFTVARPGASKFTIGKALRLLLPEVEEATRLMGYEIVYTGFDSTALQKLCQRRGYHDGGQMREQWKVVK